VNFGIVLQRSGPNKPQHSLYYVAKKVVIKSIAPGELRKKMDTQDE